MTTGWKSGESFYVFNNTRDPPGLSMETTTVGPSTDRDGRARRQPDSFPICGGSSEMRQ